MTLPNPNEWETGPRRAPDSKDFEIRRLQERVAQLEEANNMLMQAMETSPRELAALGRMCLKLEAGK